MMMALRRAMVCGVAGALSLAACTSSSDTYHPSARPPATRVETVTETRQGVTLTDDYRWLEGASSPDGSNPGQMTPDVASWTDAQRRYTRAVLDSAPGRAEIDASLSHLMDAGELSVPLMSGNRYFYWLRNAGEQFPTVYARDGALGEDRALVRPRDLDPAGQTVTNWIMPSPDGRWLAFGTSRAGEADSALRVMDVTTGARLPLEIRGSPHAVHWLPDGSGFIYQRLADPANPTSNLVLFHQMGREPGNDVLLFRQYTAAEDPNLATTAGPFASLSRDGRWLVAGYWTSADSNDLWLANFDDFRRTGQITLRPVTVGHPSRAVGTVSGDTLFVQTTNGAPNGRVMAADITNTAAVRWREVVPERPDSTIESVAYGRGLIAVTYLTQASNVTEVFDQTGRPMGTLAQPGIGTTALSASDDRTEGFLRFESFNQPPAVYRVDLQSPGVRGRQWKAATVPVSPETVGVDLVHYRSKDATDVSMFLVRRKDLAPNGALPTLLVGYGAFGVRMTPTFTANWFQWLDAGGQIAVPHVRGGGEYGPAWHAAGARDQKSHSFDDLIAAAEWLIANHDTTPDKLALYGGVAGGLLASGAMVSRPDLFRAVILVNPLTDMLRYDRFPQARLWTPEFGATDDPEAFGWLRAYSPYQRVTRGTHYPAVLLTGSDASTTVHASQARKMAAALQAATSADPADQPVLLWIEDVNSGTAPDVRERQALVDQRVFLKWQLGMP